MTLYIIGNGFDMAHGLNTSYWNFREYLDINYPEFLYEFERLYNIAQIDFSDPRVSEQTYKNWQSSVQRILWSNFEKNMGMPNIDGMMDLSASVLDDMDLDGGLVGIEDTMNQYWEEEYGFVRKFQEYVKEWIESVDTNDIQPKKMSLKESTDYFFTFNYTNLLENIYNIDNANVLHIHGGVSSVNNGEPIMGHCNKKDIEEHLQLAKEAEMEYNEGDISIHNAVVNYLMSIYKDTESIIKKNQLFWDKLRKVDKIVIIGWSAGEVDLPYLRKIRDSVNENTKWLVYYYNDTSRECLSRAMIKEKIENHYKINYVLSKEFWD